MINDIKDLEIFVHGEINAEGKLVIDADKWNFFKQQISIFANNKVSLRCRLVKKGRSEQQNRYYWGVVIPFVLNLLNNEGWNYNESDTHEYLKSEFACEQRVNEISGEVRCIPRSTSEFTKEGFMNYIDKINLFVSEQFGASLPQPDTNKLIIKRDFI